MNLQKFLSDKANLLGIGTSFVVLLISVALLATNSLPSDTYIAGVNFRLFVYFGGFCYIIAKFYLCFFEWNRNVLLKQAGWLVFMIGVLGWIVILSSKQDWIILSVELFGALMLYYGYRSLTTITDEVKDERIAKKLLNACFVVVCLVIGYYVWVDKIFTLTAWFEIVVASGFIIGSWALARDYWWGWICYILIHLATATLMGEQGEPLLKNLQYLSIAIAMLGLFGKKLTNQN